MSWGACVGSYTVGEEQRHACVNSYCREVQHEASSRYTNAECGRQRSPSPIKGVIFGIYHVIQRYTASLKNALEKDNCNLCKCVRQPVHHRNRFDLTSSPFAIRSITMFEERLEN
jgi:hypothetical protein